MVRIGYLSIDIIMMVALYQSNTLIWIFIVLANETTVYRYTCRSTPDTLSWFQTNKSWLLILNAGYIAEKQQIPILVFNWIRPGVEPTIYHTQGEHANYYTTNVVRESLTSAYQKQVWTVYFLTQ